MRIASTRLDPSLIDARRSAILAELIAELDLVSEINQRLEALEAAAAP
jgi:hypothetical protein